MCGAGVGDEREMTFKQQTAYGTMDMTDNPLFQNTSNKFTR
jgi:hypothetical protein